MNLSTGRKRAGAGRGGGGRQPGRQFGTLPMLERVTPSARQYGLLKRFRAGVEAYISYLKRCFGLAHCNWRGLRGLTPIASAGLWI